MFVATWYIVRGVCCVFLIFTLLLCVWSGRQRSNGWLSTDASASAAAVSAALSHCSACCWCWRDSTSACAQIWQRQLTPVSMLLTNTTAVCLSGSRFCHSMLFVIYTGLKVGGLPGSIVYSLVALNHIKYHQVCTKTHHFPIKKKLWGGALDQGLREETGLLSWTTLSTE